MALMQFSICLYTCTVLWLIDGEESAHRQRILQQKDSKLMQESFYRIHPNGKESTSFQQFIHKSSESDFYVGLQITYLHTVFTVD